jgi:4-amino-4-deoxy-L-arabinose transferase-like glycosyltransferase
LPLATPHRHRTLARDLAVPLLIALLLRMLLALVPVGPSWDGVIYARAAEQIAAGEGYTLRSLAEGNRPLPTAFYPVGFPAVLAFVRLLGGAYASDRLLQSTATLLLVPISYLLARRARGRRAGRAAAWIAALWPGGLFLSATWLAEPTFALGLGLALLPVAYARRRQRLVACLLAALTLGFVAYLRPSALPIAGLVGLGLGWVWWRARALHVRALAGGVGAALFVAVACVPLAPWVVRNQRALHAPVLVSTNGGVNLLIGALGDGSFETIRADHPCKVGGLREIERDRCYSASARALIAAAPLAWTGRALVKLAHTMGHDSAAAQCFSEGLHVPPAWRELLRLWALGLCRVAWLPLLAAALVGASRLTRRLEVSTVLLLAPILSIAALHMVYLGGDRYHAAVAPMFIALAGIAVARPRRTAPI